MLYLLKIMNELNLNIAWILCNIPFQSLEAILESSNVEETDSNVVADHLGKTDIS